MKTTSALALAIVLTSAQAHAIVGGSPDTTRPEVLLFQDDTLPGFRCTATLIAPNLVITARHCVGKRAVPAATTLCKGGATNEGAQSLPNYAGDAPASPMYFTAAPGAPLLARGATVYDDGSTTTCSHDVALIALDRSIAGITPAQLRRTPVAQGDELIAMGFGWINRTATLNATERMKGITHVLALGPAVYSFKPNGDPTALSESVAIASGEIGVEGLTMTGDSGGPAFDATGQLVALVSRGYSDALYGPGTFTTIAAHLATIDAALVATGNAAPGDAGVDATTPPGADASVPGMTPPARDAGATSDAAAGGDSSGCSVSMSKPAPKPASSGSVLGLAVAIVCALRAGSGRASRRRSPCTRPRPRR